MEGSNTKESLSCAGCLNEIGDDDYVSALAQDWHKDCFRCSVCDGVLTSWYLEKAGLLFCQADYWARYGECCLQCSQVITGPVMAAGEHRFHPECFACGACGAHIEDGESYALLDRSRLYCGGCYSGRAGPPAAGGGVGGGGGGGAHTIRAVEVRAGAVRLQPDHHAALRVTEIDPSCGLLALHIGDRILEINGAPAHGRTLRDIPADTLVQLTVEHNPETINSTNNNNNINNNTKRPTESDEKTKHDTKSPIERKILRDDLKRQAPKEGSVGDCEESVGGRKERLFKRKGGEGGERGGARLKRRQTPSSPLLGDKERSSSMSKLLDVVDGGGGGEDGVLGDLSRARSFRARPAPGQTVFRAADLLLGELLGSGFFGQVYKVTHRDTNEVMVLKQLYRVDDCAQRNFLKEVAVLRSLSHPNVLRFVGVLYKDKRLHLVTEYVCGGTLHQLLQDTSVPLSWSVRARLARDVAAGVGYLHRMNVIHRDLNSHNCLVREDKTVIVADFGLARIVQRTAPPHAPPAPAPAPAPHSPHTPLSPNSPQAHTHTHSRTRKRYTVVGNPYWMAPEMMNGNVYDEKVDVFSFGIILCEIIGRVSADPDYLPRRADFGLNEQMFTTQFCQRQQCPEPLYRLAFRACHLDPDLRPSFEVMEGWLERLIVQLSEGGEGVEGGAEGGPSFGALLRDIAMYAGCADGHECAACLRARLPDACALVKSQSNATVGAATEERTPDGPAPPPPPDVGAGVLGAGAGAGVGAGGGRALGKCVSASHIGGRKTVTVHKLSRSHQALYPAAPGYILSSTGDTINITKVDDITEWLEPPPLKRCSPDPHLDRRTVRPAPPAFLRNQSHDPRPARSDPLVHRPSSIPDGPHPDASDSDTSSDESWPSKQDLMDVDRSVFSDIMRKGETLLAKKSSYDVTLRNPECLTHERRIPEADYRRYNIDHLTRSPIMAEGVKNIPKTIEAQRSGDRTNFFTKKLLSPKLSRLFKTNTTELPRSKDEDKEEKSRSKFFVQRPASPGNIGRSHRVRPLDNTDRKDSAVLRSDLKLASLGKPMTPIFRRHIPERPEFADGRYSCRDRRVKCGERNDGKFLDVGRNRIKAPMTAEKAKITQLTPVIEKDKEKKRESGISRSNYVSLANLKINGKPKQLEGKGRRGGGDGSPVERVI